MTIMFLTDLPCRARDVGIDGRSIVCVCDANYCDTITKETPARGSFVAYTSTNVSCTYFKENIVYVWDQNL